MPAISVVIVNWNGHDHLQRCLRSLAGQTDRAFETVVVDNGSSDASLRMIAREFPGVRTLALGANLGFAEGANAGIRATDSEWVATLNNDAVADARWIETLRAAAARGEPRLGMLQSCIVFASDPTRTNSTGVLLKQNGSAIDRDFGAPRRAADAEDEIFCASAGAALYRRAMLNELELQHGFFDRDFFMYFEDVDLGWRARLAGWSASYLPNALVHHAFHGTAGRHGSRFVRVQCNRNRARMLLKNASFALLLRSLPRTLSDLAETLVMDGPRALLAFLSAAASALAERARVSRLARVDRRALERRWLASTA